jgi:lipid II:glycine glycyltransferase (peptidoglycan interpeptide bridge formation enzyme)
MLSLKDKAQTLGPRTVFRFNSYVPRSAEMSYAALQSFTRPARPLNSGFSILFDLREGHESFQTKMTSKHRYYVKDALKADLTWRFGNDDEDFACFSKLYSEMGVVKGLGQLEYDGDRLTHLQTHLRNHVLILTGYKNMNPVTTCMVLTFGQNAYYFLAATGLEGREYGAAYAMVLKLVENLGQRGFVNFDFGGIAPFNPKAQGVDHFKKGFGGVLTEYLGEFEHATSAPLRLAFNFRVAQRAGS